MSWESVFMPSTSLLEVFLRGTIMYLAVFVLMRIAGRRESGELNTSDLILVVIISEAASVGIAGENHSIFDGVILVATILFWSIALDAAGYRWTWMSALLKPRPRALIKDGQLDHHTARREFLTKEEILSQLRLNGVEDITDVHRAYIEPNGVISIIPRES